MSSPPSHRAYQGLPGPHSFQLGPGFKPALLLQSPRGPLPHPMRPQLPSSPPLDTQLVGSVSSSSETTTHPPLLVFPLETPGLWPHLLKLTLWDHPISPGFPGDHSALRGGSLSAPPLRLPSPPQFSLFSFLSPLFFPFLFQV